MGIIFVIMIFYSVSILIYACIKKSLLVAFVTFLFYVMFVFAIIGYVNIVKN
jgi:hypothetical protein